MIAEGKPENEERPYEVGYKQPPKDRQWKKGESGNTRGRPKGSKSLKAIVREQAARTIEAKADGKSQRVALAEALVMRILRDGVSGRAAAMQSALKLVERYVDHDEPAAAPPVAHDLSILTDWELNLYAWIVYRIEKSPDDFWAMIEEDLRKGISDRAADPILQRSIGRFYEDQTDELADEQRRVQTVVEAHFKRRRQVLERVCGDRERSG